MEENVSLKNQNITIKRKNLHYLGFNKFIAMYLIIRMHLYCNKTMPFDFGIRACEFLFISSGFLIGYNYYNTSFEFTYASPFKYAYKHLRSFYPYYLLNLFYGLYFYKDFTKFNLTYVELLLINLLLIANWSSHRRIARFYFGISWFLDNIFYCYFISPFCLYTIKETKNSLKILFFMLLTRILIEEFLKNGAYNVFDTNLHCGPIIRILEFYIGMLLSPLYFSIKHHMDKIKNNYIFKILFTIIHIIMPIFLYYLMVKYDKVLLRCYFILIICIYIIIISYDYGYLSYITEFKLLKIIMSTQLEMYLIQINIHITFDRYLAKKNIHLPGLLIYYIKLMCIFTIAFIYRKFYRDKLANLLDKLLILMK